MADSWSDPVRIIHRPPRSAKRLNAGKYEGTCLWAFFLGALRSPFRASGDFAPSQQLTFRSSRTRLSRGDNRVNGVNGVTAVIDIESHHRVLAGFHRSRFARLSHIQRPPAHTEFSLPVFIPKPMPLFRGRVGERFA